MEPDAPLDHLWREYSEIFRDFDDLTLARWMAQTLSQLRGRAWRLSHPLVSTYRLACQAAYERQIWLKNLVAMPHGYLESNCCRAPQLPLLTRDILDSGLVCQHCSGSSGTFDDLPRETQAGFRRWAQAYKPVHATAHWEESRQRRCPDYEEALETAAEKAEQLLITLGTRLAPSLLEHFPTVVWEDQDECLEVRPEDILLSSEWPTEAGEETG